MWMGPGTWYPGPKLGGGGCEYTGAMGGCEYGGGGAVGAFCPGNVLKGGCISDCCELVAPLSRKLVTSAFITRPPAPEPGTLLRSSPCSCATLRPTGVERTPFASAAGACAELEDAACAGPEAVGAVGVAAAFGADVEEALPASSRSQRPADRDDRPLFRELLDEHA